MRRTTIVTAAALVTLALAGCSAAGPEAESAPTASPTEDANADACTSFETLVTSFNEKVVGGVEASGRDLESYRTDLLDDRARLDEIGLGADGAVAERIGLVVEEISSTSPWDMTIDPADYSAAVTDVQTACGAAGADITPSTITRG
jgi:hypothetical protein